jgi:hypothetical protein
LSDEDEQEIKENLEKRKGELEADREKEDDAAKRGELEDKIGEIREVLEWIDSHVTQLDAVIDRETGKIRERRERAAKEFEVALTESTANEGAGQDTEEVGRLSPSEQAYRDQLARGARQPVGLAFSSGGIRSATFNLGLAQGLARYGFLP